MNRIEEADLGDLIRTSGFYKFGATRLPLDEAYLSYFSSWISQGNHANMQWLEKNYRARRSGTAVLPNARSVLVLLAPSSPRNPAECPPKPSGPGEMRIADFALGVDYHNVLRAAAEPIAQRLREVFPLSLWRICIDSAPLFERAAAFASGLGFIGRNSMLIDPDSPYGSRFYIVCIIGTADLKIDRYMEAEWIVDKQKRHCGDCRLCIDSCPGGALSFGQMFDACRCVSYMTIEKRGEMTPEEHERAGDRLFGCDTCQDVCPYNAIAPITPFLDLRENVRTKAYVPANAFDASKMTRGEFRRQFSDSSLWRAGITKLRKRTEFFRKKK